MTPLFLGRGADWFLFKCIGHGGHTSWMACQVINEIRYGGATYVSTGRGLPTDRRPFIGEAVPGKCPDLTAFVFV